MYELENIKSWSRVLCVMLSWLFKHKVKRKERATHWVLKTVWLNLTLFISYLQWEINAQIQNVIYSSNSFPPLYSIDFAASNGYSRVLYPKIRHLLNLNSCPHRASEPLRVWYASFILEGRKLHSLFPQPTSQHGFLWKGWNNCSLSLHLCDTEKPENPPWISMKKACKSHLWHGEQRRAEVAAIFWN